MIEHQMNNLSMMDVLDMAVVWDATTPAPQNPSEVTNVFDSRGITWAQVKRHANLSAANRLVVPRNQRKLRQVMFGKMLWSSIALKYQLELLTEESLFKREGNHNGLLLWHHIMERVNPSTKVTVANLKDEIEGATLDNFGHDIK
eukprot:7773266-Ditylum_brightwellii.AAC.1